jgi:hypothetical protein
MPDYRQRYTGSTLPAHLVPSWLAEIQFPPISAAEARAGLMPRWDLAEDEAFPVESEDPVREFAAHIAEWVALAEDEAIFAEYWRPCRTRHTLRRSAQ